jgi:hypothetical protein
LIVTHFVPLSLELRLQYNQLGVGIAEPADGSARNAVESARNAVESARNAVESARNAVESARNTVGIVRNAVGIARNADGIAESRRNRVAVEDKVAFFTQGSRSGNHGLEAVAPFGARGLICLTFSS